MQPEPHISDTDPHACCAGKHANVLSVDIAGAKALAAAVPIRERQTMPLLEATGRVLSSPLCSPMNLPPFDNSAMDGFAVRTTDFEGPGPWRLPVAGRVAAGDGSAASYPPASTVRLFTGAPVPRGFDAVIMQENCERSGETVIFRRRPEVGQNVRYAGEDVARGAVTLASGLPLTAARIALLAAIGTDRVDVWRKVRVGLISTGSELRETGQALGPGQIYNSNRHFLRAAMQRPWIEVADFGIVPDDPGAIRAAIRAASESNDVVITTGGVSAGEEDHMMDVLRRENAELEVLKVAMRPGKPVTVGKIGGALFFGLPGNPYATVVTFSRIALPAIKTTAGSSVAETSWMPAVSGFTYRRRSGRTEYVPVTWSRRDDYGRPIVEMLGRGCSASLAPIAAAMAVAVLPPDMALVEPGLPLRIEAFCE